MSQAEPMTSPSTPNKGTEKFEDEQEALVKHAYFELGDEGGGYDADDLIHRNFSWETHKYVLMEHGCFFAGALIATVSSSLELRTSKWWLGTEDDDDCYGDDTFSKEVVGPWTLFQLLQIISTGCYLLDAILHFSFTPVTAKGRARRVGMMLFGFAALCDLLSCVFDYDEESTGAAVTSVATTMIAVHLFFLSAIFNIVKSRRYFATFGQEMWGIRCVVMGDALFLVATTIDVLSAYNEGEDTYANWTIYSRWQVSSAVLWLADAILYIAADLLPADEVEEDGHKAIDQYESD